VNAAVSSDASFRPPQPDLRDMGKPDLPRYAPWRPGMSLGCYRVAQSERQA
jgi:hypothetical protein